MSRLIEHHGLNRLLWDTQANGSEAALAKRWIDAADAHSLSQAVAFEDPDSCPVLKGAEDFDWHGRRATQSVFE